MKKAVKVLSCFTASALLTAAIPLYASAAETNGKVRVIVENNTFSEASGAKWDGVLVDEWVDIKDDSSAMTALLEVLSEKGYTQSGAEYDYITEINGLNASDGGTMGAWMATLDDWFTDEGISAYTVSSGKLEDGDEIRFMYTLNWGADLGYDWSSTDTSLSSLTFSDGELSPEFNSFTDTYVLTLPENTEKIAVYPTAASKSFRTKIYKNEYTAAENGTDYKKGEEIEVSDGDVIIIGVANSAWMNYVPDGVTESVYKVAVNQETEQPDIEVQQAESLISAIGEVTKSSENAVKSARAYYDSLSDEQKAKVSNYETLTEAERILSELPTDKKAVSVEELRNIYKSNFPENAVYGNEWDMITLARFELMSDEIKENYIKSVKEYLDLSGNAKISSTRSTAVSGLIAALTSVGVDVSDFNGYNLLEPLSDIDYVSLQGVNGAFYALIALDSHSYEIPNADGVNNQTTREKLIELILNSQGTDGGWTFDTGSSSDADMTSMAIQSLAPYYTTNDKVKSAVDKALSFLSENQRDNGGFVSYGSQDSESCSQVITALCSLGIDISKDERFIKNGNTAYDALLGYYNESDGKFAHSEGGESNALSTSQAYTAISALYRLENGKTSFYNMTDVEFTATENESSHTDEPSKNEQSVTEPSQESSKEESKPSETKTSAVAENSVNSTAQNSSNGTASTVNTQNTNAVNTGDIQHTGIFIIAMFASLGTVFALGKKKVKR